MPTRTWNLKDILVPNKSRKLPQVIPVTILQLPEKKELAIAHVTCMTGNASPSAPTALRWDQREPAYVKLTIFLVPEEHTVVQPMNTRML